MTRLALAALLILLAPALSSLAKVSVDDAPKSNLIDSGSEPHMDLRYSVNSGDKWLLFLDRALDLQLYWGGKPMNVGRVPGVRFRIPVQALSADDNTIKLRLSKLSIELIPSKETSAAKINALTSSWEPLQRITVDITIDSRGGLISSKVETPDHLTPYLEGELEDLVQTIENLIVQLPTELVGAKGVWTTDSPSKHLQFTGTQSRRITLASVVDGILALKVHSKRDFPRQSKKPFHNPDLETLHYFRGSEEKTTRVDTHCPFPIFTATEGSSEKEVDNLLGMLAKSERGWKIEAGIVSAEDDDKAWAKISSLFPTSEPSPKKD